MKLVDDIPMYAYNGSTCFICGCGKHEGETAVIDLDRNIDMEGDLYMCIACGLDLARLLGCFSPDEATKLRTQLRATEDDLLNVNIELKAIQDRVFEAVTHA